jgi:phosphate acetyltransferase
MRFADELKRKVAKGNKKIVLPESNSRRVLKAAERIMSEEYARVILIGRPQTVVEEAARFQIDLDGIEIIDPRTYPMLDTFCKYVLERSPELTRSAAEVRELLISDANYFASCLVAFDIADGMVSGAVSTPQHVFKAAYEVIGARPGCETVTSSLILLTNTPQYGDDGIFVLGDCGVIADPTPEQLADIACFCVERARATVQILEPKVAFMSFSTMGSGSSPTVDKIKETMEILKARDVDFEYDGEMQADAALVPQIGEVKAPDSKVAGHANILIFPNIDTANVSYKLLQRLANAKALGPLYQGLAKPVMDLSRSCTIEDISDVVAICCNDAIFLETEIKRDIAFTSRFEKLDRRVAVDCTNSSIQFDPDKCKNCTLCRRRCANTMSITGYYSLTSTGDVPICVHCGQCSLTCQFGATTTLSQVEAVEQAINDPDTVVIFQTAPAVRVSLGEAFGMPAGSIVQGKMVGALRKLGADYVFDTNFGADLTIMEEASELLQRLENKQAQLPMFTSCCPAWVEFAEIYFPELIPHLSTAKSPISILSPMIKTYFAKKKGIDPKRIVNVCVTPCTAKKTEILRPELNASAAFWNVPELRDTDLCITTRELARWIEEKGLRFEDIEDSPYDEGFGQASGGGIIFGNSGGLMEAALRTAHCLHTGEETPFDYLPFEAIRGFDGVKKASIMYNDNVVNVAAISGLAHARKFIEELERRHTLKKYAFIEVMACPGGCIGGGGQPRTKLSQELKTRQARTASLYQLEQACPMHSSWENQEIQALYKEFLGKPLGEVSEKMLHTHFVNRHFLLGKEDRITPEDATAH